MFVGDFPNLGPISYNPDSIANILSLRDVRKVCHVTMDTSQELALLVHRLEGTVMKFVEQKCGLYVFKPNTNNSTIPQGAAIHDKQGADLREDMNDHPTFEPEVEQFIGLEEGANNETENNETPVSDQGVMYNLRNRASIKAPVRLVQVMDNSSNSKSYDTPTVLLQKIMTQASLGTTQPTLSTKHNL